MDFDDTDPSDSYPVQGTGGRRESFLGVATGYSYPGIRRDTRRMARIWGWAIVAVMAVCVGAALIGLLV